MKELQKQQNQKFFEQLIRIIPENGIYYCPDANEVYYFLNGSIRGSKRGINKIKEITPKPFHSKLFISK